MLARKAPSGVIVFSLLWGASAVLSGEPGPFDPVAYRLLEGSVLVDEPVDGERPTIEVPIRGTFVRTRLPVRRLGELHSLTEIRFESAGGEYTVTGVGAYDRLTLEDGMLGLDLEINGAGGIELRGERVPAFLAWPAFANEASEDGKRDPLHLYSVRLVAAPERPAVRYELVPGDPSDGTGSFLVDDCTVCGRPTILVPLKGTFLLAEIEGGGPDPFATYSVDRLDLETPEGAPSYEVTGAGTYRWGGEVALVQEMDLALAVNGNDARFGSGIVEFPEGVSFPQIDIRLRSDPKKLIVYTLDLVARPVGDSGPFRRGDSNADGSVDISDAVHLLLWKFQGVPGPSCIDAADTNDDERTDVSDAVFLLDFLFRSGAVPPAPGPTACGLADTPSAGCASYPPCG